ncbi:MAG: hypothetical protein JXQ91_18025 [Vannielia sp.]|uniref:hypothetical protein n=1 Tax=Rhodobacterales TaxID=204455 RepID=UPI002094F97F|nr:hypothetical protein [Oceanicola sp. 502str15]MCO6383813.1 hypothetical protein [Oceanicola sp. 502str15]
MRRVALGALLAAFAALPALAEVEMIDTDGDGMASFEEIAAIYEGFTEEQFAAIDTDQDGVLSDEELTAAVEAGDLEALGD